MGVARLSFGGCCRVGMVRAGFATDVLLAMAGAAALLTGLWAGEAGMARPSLGIRLPDCARPAPGTGGRRNGTGEAMMGVAAAAAATTSLGGGAGGFPFSARVGNCRSAASEQHDSPLHSAVSGDREMMD